MESTSLNSDLIELLRGLNAAFVKYLIVGAHAVGTYITPRATADLDIWIARTRENAERTYRALAEFGAPVADLSINDLQSDDLVFTFGKPPFRVDILTDISGVTFEEAWPTRVEGTMFGVPVSYIGRKDLIRNKRATGRTKDLADIEALEAPQ